MSWRDLAQRHRSRICEMDYHDRVPDATWINERGDRGLPYDFDLYGIKIDIKVVELQYDPGGNLTLGIEKMLEQAVDLYVHYDSVIGDPVGTILKTNLIELLECKSPNVRTTGGVAIIFNDALQLWED
jgi:hypothetical protein